jgi:hypothetical protein
VTDLATRDLAARIANATNRELARVSRLTGMGGNHIRQSWGEPDGAAKIAGWVRREIEQILGEPTSTERRERRQRRA